MMHQSVTIVTNYNTFLVAISILIAVIAAYTAIDFAGRVTVSEGKSKSVWLIGGAIGMGSGIWSMHFIAMLALHLDRAVSYDILIVLISWLAAIASSGLALFLVSRAVMTLIRLLGGGVLMGLGIATMHYTGMLAMQMNADIHYDSLLVAISVGIAIAVSIIALWLVFQLREANTLILKWLKLGSAIIMGAAVSSMHYTGMAAASFIPKDASEPETFNILDTYFIAVTIGIGTFIILLLGLVASFFDRHVALKLAKASQENEQKFQTLIQNLQVGVLLLGANLEVLVSNKLAIELLDLDPNKLESKSLLDLDLHLVGKDGTKIPISNHALMLAVTSGKPVQDLVINVYHAAQKRQFSLLVNTEPQLKSDGSVEQIICSFIDITERQQAEEQLQLSEAKYRELAQQEILLNNLAGQIHNSLELDTILFTAVREIRNLLNIEQCNFFWYVGGMNGYSFELTHSAHSSTVENSNSYCPLQSLESLREKILLEDLLCIDNLAKELELDANKRPILNSYSSTSILAIAFHTNSGQIGVISCENSTQPRHWTSEEVALLKAVANQLAIAIDQAQLYEQSCAMTKSARLQAEQLEQALLELQETQSQLIHSEKMSSLGQTVAGVAHEINNPVNFIHGNINHAGQYIQDLLNLIHLYQQHYPNCHPEIQAEIEAIDLEFVVKDLPKMLNSMKIGTDRIREIVLSLRNFSRLDEADMKVVDIHEGIDNTLLILQHKLKTNQNSSSIQIIKKYGNLPKIECYPGQLNQVFMNIIGNAIDALDYRNPQLWPATSLNMIRIVTETTESNTVIIRIADNGSGMNEDVRKRIFDPFFTTKAVGKGTGLGLAISYKIIVERHGGSLRCESKPEQGTEFWIEIPIKQKVYQVREPELLAAEC